MINELTDDEIIELSKETKVLPLLSDTLGKNIFKKNKKLTTLFLKDTLRLNFPINKIEFIDTELETDKPTNYKFITDLLICLNDNIIVNIELCRDYYNKHKERLCAYVYKLSSLNIKKGTNLKKDLNQIKQIVFACKDKSPLKAYRNVKLCDVDNGEVISENLEIYIHYIEIHKKKYYNNVDVNKEDLWFTLFASMSLIEQNNILKKLVSDDIRYEFIWSVYKMCNDKKIIADFGAEDYNNYVIENMKKEIKEQGFEEGIEEGIEQGIKKGIEQTKVNIVTNMLNMKINYTVISNATGLSIEEIKQIENNM